MEKAVHFDVELNRKDLAVEEQVTLNKKLHCTKNFFSKSLWKNSFFVQWNLLLNVTGNVT